GQKPGEPDKAYSVELCGGTHVRRTGDIALFKIVGESAVSAGVRRVEALTGEAAREYLEQQAGIAKAAADTLKVPVSELEKRLAALVDERRKLEKELSDAKTKLAMGGGGGAAPAAVETIGNLKFTGRIVEGVGGKELRSLVDAARAEMGSGIAAFVGINDGKAAIAVGVTDDLAGSAADAVALVRAGSAAIGGKGGGGRPDFAQAGGPDASKGEEALEAIRAVLAGKG
ncbi:MAG TPA: alanine--tRNA ligase, partial [Oceanicaulis sp.]|nr:alanine--tRNA ligase [Oceanicaulis sp.]